MTWIGGFHGCSLGKTGQVCVCVCVNMNMNMCVYIPVEQGSVTLRTAAMAMAASTALPPFLSTSRPVWEAKGWEEATMPVRVRVCVCVCIGVGICE